jgi:hypothetical protein
MITKELVETQGSCNEELAIKLYDILHTKDIKRQTTLHWPVANKLGINQALLLEIVHNWTEYNAHKGAMSYFHDDNWWTSDTYEHWFASYPAFGSVRTLQRLFKELENLGYIISCRPFGKNKNGTKFYRVSKAKVGSLLLDESPFRHISDSTSRQNGKSDSPNWQEPPAKMANPTIYINNIKEEENKNRTENVLTQNSESPKVEVLTDGHPIQLMEQRLRDSGTNELYLREQAANIWMEEKPGNFVDLPNNRLDHKSWATFKANYLNQYGEKEGLEMLRDSLIYAREYDDSQSRPKFSWRRSDMRLTFGEWVNSLRTEKIYCLSSKHKHSMIHDTDYADRVQGRACSNSYLDDLVPLGKVRDGINDLVNAKRGVDNLEKYLNEMSEKDRAREEQRHNQLNQGGSYDK